MLGLYQRSVDRHAATEFEKEDGRGNAKALVASRQPHRTITFNGLQNCETEMKEPSTPFTNLPPEQQAIRGKCFHPSGKFIEFPLEDVETSVCARFEKIVAQYPDNWAIVTDAESLTYAELNERANRVAHSIIDQRGIDVELIGLLFERKLNLAVAMLGVLKTGTFFVLLDPAWPESRLRVILNDAQAKLLLTRFDNRDRMESRQPSHKH